eukprot:TCONS_00003350-protein
MKFMSTSAQHLRMEQRVVEAGRHQLKYFDKLKKEFNLIRSLYLACHGRVQAIDELEMCISRLRFPTHYEEMTEGFCEARNDIVRLGEVSQTRYALLSDRVTASEELKLKNGQMAYLQNLAKVQEDNNGSNPEPCPICVFPLGSEWAVMTCGHSVCCKCMTTLQKRSNYKRAAIQCPMCRAQSKLTAISIVTAKPAAVKSTDTDRASSDSNDDILDANISVQGNFSTKIEAVVRRILWIQIEQPKAKTLVFSTWTNVLKVISQALSVNNVEFKSLAGAHPKQFERFLTFFKENEICNVLLLPLHSGAKGLNIIEASHLILTEPALNPSDELQAVGRVHRIGQDKETYVHRFFVRDTVEEKMYHLFKPKSTQGENTLENELTVDDVVNLIQKTQDEEGDVFASDSGDDENTTDGEDEGEDDGYFF